MQILIGAVQTLQHALLGRRQIGDHAVQEQRRLVQQPLRRFDALDHDAARHGVQSGVLVRGQLAAGEHHHRHVAQLRIVADLLQHLEAGHIGQLQIEHHAIDRILAQLRHSRRAGVRRRDFDVLVAQQFRDALALGLVVLDQQQTLAARRRHSP